MGMHVSVVIMCSSVRVIVGSFVHASVIISQERKKEEGSKSTRPIEARQGQQLRENRNSPNQERPSRRNEQTNHNQACHLQPEIHHSWVCMYPLSFIVCSFVRSIVHASVIISQERKKKGVSQGARQRLDRDNKREKTETVQTKTIT